MSDNNMNVNVTAHAVPPSPTNHTSSSLSNKVDNTLDDVMGQFMSWYNGPQVTKPGKTNVDSVSSGSIDIDVTTLPSVSFQGGGGGGGQAPAINLQNPQVLAADPVKSANAVVKLISAGANVVKEFIHFNLFLGKLVGVALLESMMEFMKSQQVLEKISSNMDLSMKQTLLEVSRFIADQKLEKSKQEAYKSFAMAACSFGALLCSAGGLGMTAGWAKGDQGRQQIVKMATDMGTQLSTGVLQNLASGIQTMKIGGLDYTIEVMESIKNLIDQLSQKIGKMGDDASKNFDDFRQALQQWLTQLSKVAEKITTH